VTVFDAYRASKALEGHLSEGDSMQNVAVDDVSRDYWVITGHELILLADTVIKVRYPLDQLAGEVVTTQTGVEVRVRAGKTELAIASFRRPNKVTERLAAIVGADT
jgi:hypothetical protein